MVGVVVVNHRTPELAARCAASLQASAAVGAVVVVETGGDVAPAPDPGAEIRIEVMTENRGFGAAANRGAALIDGEFVLITNADVYFEPDAVEELLGGLRRQARWGLAAPLLRDSAGDIQESSFRFPGLAQAVIDLLPAPGWLRRSRLNGRYPAAWAASRDFAIDHPLGACLLVRREAFDAVGGFDESFFMYAEEIDLCRRLQNAGWQSGHVAGAAAVHVGGASTGQNRERMIEQLYISRARYFAAHHGAAYATAAKLAMAAGLAASPIWNRLPRYRGLGLGVVAALRLAGRVARA
jgi:N-acetylglucosaminyl-diphospho-decaprenol L-rhamnosyltransferase